MTTDATPGALGSNDGLGAWAKAPVYCWSHDGKSYHGDFVTREDAIEEATAELEFADEPGEERVVYTGVQAHAMHFLRKNARRIAEDFAETIDEWLADDIASDEPIIKLVDPHGMGNDLLAALERHCGFESWAVKDIQEHSVTVPGEQDAPNARGNAPDTARTE